MKKGAARQRRGGPLSPPAENAQSAAGSLFSGLNLSFKAKQEVDDSSEEATLPETNTVIGEDAGFSFVTEEEPEKPENAEETKQGLQTDLLLSVEAEQSSFSSDTGFSFLSGDVDPSPSATLLVQPAVLQPKPKKKRAVRPGHARKAEHSELNSQPESGEREREQESDPSVTGEKEEGPPTLEVPKPEQPETVPDGVKGGIEHEEEKKSEIAGDGFDFARLETEVTGGIVEEVASTEEDVLLDELDKDSTCLSSESKDTSDICTKEEETEEKKKEEAEQKREEEEEKENEKEVISISEKPSDVLASFPTQLELMKKEIESAEVHWKDYIERKKNALKMRLQKRQEVKKLLVEQAVAVEEENYEAADELNSSLEALQSELMQMSLDEKEGEEREKAVVLRRAAVERVTELRNKQIVELDKCKGRKENEQEHLSKEALRRVDIEKEKIENMTEKLERHRSHIEMDRLHLKKSEDLLAKEFEERTTQFSTNKRDLLTVRDSVKAEISEVEARLTLLRSQEKELDDSIVSVEEKISSVEQEMAEERQKLSSQKIQIEQQQSTLDVEMEELTTAQEVFDEKVKEHQEASERLSAEISGFSEQIEQAKGEVEKLKENEMALEEFVNSQLSLSADATIQELYDKERRLRVDVETAASNLLEKQNAALKIKKRLKDIGELLPEMHERKKLAAAGRNFKEAGRLAKEAGLMAEECHALEKDLADVDQKVLEFTKNLQEKKDQHEEYKTKVTNQERDHELCLLENARTAARLIRERTLKLSDGEGSTLWLLMEAEADWCESVVEELSFKHDLTDPSSSLTHQDADRGNDREKDSDSSG
eukprot:m.39414 g.39414  ORF g.39414 m.39414 type:complete len:828 (+) comp32736_c0_seq1:3-2486(+)